MTCRMCSLRPGPYGEETKPSRSKTVRVDEQMDHGLKIVRIGSSDVGGHDHAMPVPRERPVIRHRDRSDRNQEIAQCSDGENLFCHDGSFSEWLMLALPTYASR